MIIIIDLGISNIESVSSAFKRIGANFEISCKPEKIAHASTIVLPGVGAYADGVKALHKYALAKPITEAARQQVPILGICLGMQLLADSSREHGEHQGLGLIAGKVEQLVADQPGYRVPNIGWCDVHPVNSTILFPSGREGGIFYFAHSYHFIPEDTNTIAATMPFCDKKITVAIKSGNIFGVQFHPEKSQDNGLDLLNTFLQFAQRQHASNKTDTPHAKICDMA